MPIFLGYKGTGTPNSWEGLIDEALPCVGGCGAGGGGTCSIVSQNIFGFSLFPKLKILILSVPCSPKLVITFVSLFPSFLDHVFFCPPEINEIIPLFPGRASSI